MATDIQIIFERQTAAGNWFAAYISSWAHSATASHFGASLPNVTSRELAGAILELCSRDYLTFHLLSGAADPHESYDTEDLPEEMIEPMCAFGAQLPADLDFITQQLLVLDSALFGQACFSLGQAQDYFASAQPKFKGRAAERIAAISNSLRTIESVARGEMTIRLTSHNRLNPRFYEDPPADMQPIESLSKNTSFPPLTGIKPDFLPVTADTLRMIVAFDN